MQKKYKINLEMSYLCLIIVPSNINDMKTAEQMTARELAKAIAIYNGQKGTYKQIEKLIKFYNGDKQSMMQFAQGRIININI